MNLFFFFCWNSGIVGLSDFVVDHKKLPVHVNLSRLKFHHVEIFAAEMIWANRAKKKKNNKK